MCYLQATGTLQLIFKSELPSLTGDGGKHKEVTLGAISEGEEKPSDHPQEIDIKALPASGACWLEDSFLSRQSDMERKLHPSLPFSYTFCIIVHISVGLTFMVFLI